MRVRFIFFIVCVFFSFVDKGFCLPTEEDQVHVTLQRTTLVHNPKAIEFVEKCLELDPNYYRFVLMPSLLNLLHTQNPSKNEDRKLQVHLSAFDEKDNLMGWYFIKESKKTTEQISGILGFDGTLETGYADICLIYLPPSKLLSRSNLTKKVLSLATEIVQPHLQKKALFLKDINNQTLEPLFEEKEVMGISASIYCRNYPSLISAYRSGFRAVALCDSNFLGHDLLVVNPPYKRGNIPAIEKHLDETPEMRTFVLRANKAMKYLENPHTRSLGKLMLYWNDIQRREITYTILKYSFWGLIIFSSLKMIL